MSISDSPLPPTHPLLAPPNKIGLFSPFTPEKDSNTVKCESRPMIRVRPEFHTNTGVRFNSDKQHALLFIVLLSICSLVSLLFYSFLVISSVTRGVTRRVQSESNSGLKCWLNSRRYSLEWRIWHQQYEQGIIHMSLSCHHRGL